MEKRSLYTEIRDLCRLNPSRISIVDHDGAQISAALLCEKVERRAFALEESRPEAKYVILLARVSANYHAWSLAILGRGRVLVPVDSNWPAARVEQAIEEVRRIDPHAAVIRADDPLSTEGKCPADMVMQNDSPAVVLFTSGTTGKPKGVVLSYGFLLKQETDIAPDQIRSVRFQSGFETNPIHDALFQYASVSVAVQMNYTVALAHGYTVVCQSGAQALDVPHATRLFHRYRIKRILITPSFCERLLDFPEWFSTFEEIRVFGEAVASAFQQRLCSQIPESTRLLDVYGQTEVAIWLASRDLRTDHGWRGRSDAGVVIDAGELCVFDPMEHTLFLGYLGEAKRNPTDCFRSGDLAEGTPDQFHLGGRNDGMRKVRGFRIELEDTESVLSRITQRPGAVAVQDDRLLAFVARGETSESEHDFEARVKSRMQEELPAYQVPDRILFCDEIPYSDALKIDRAKLLDLMEDEKTTWPAGSEDPAIRLFETLFPSEKEIGDDSSFSDLGGHSLLLLKAMAQLRHDGLEGCLSPAEILKLDTVAKIRNALDQQPIGTPESLGSNPVHPVARAFSHRPPRGVILRDPKMIIRHARNVKRVVEITRVDVPVDSSLSDSDLEQALEKLVDAHPVLRTRGQRKGMTTIPVPSESSINALNAPTSRFLPWGWKRGEPLFRAQRLSNESIRLSVHHSISDNQSCQILARDFQQIVAGSELSPRPYHHLERVRTTLEALPRLAPYSVPNHNLERKSKRWNRVFPVEFQIDDAFLLPSLILSFARAWQGPIEVPVYMDGRTAPHLLDVDATQLVSFLAVSRAARAEPEMTLRELRNRLDLSPPDYYSGLSFRGHMSDIMKIDQIGVSARERTAYGQGDIVLNVLETGGLEEQPDHLARVPSSLGEFRNPAVASIYSEYYLDNRRLFVVACGPTRSWVEDLAKSIQELASGGG